MNYNEVMCYIEDTAKLGSHLGTERTEKILELLGNPQNKFKCIHVAGTNGKGSTTAMIANTLVQAGLKVGMYTSPYIEEFEERIQINGENIPKEALAKVVTKVSEATKKVMQLGYDHPTQFEIITCAMFLYYCEQNVDFAVVEVGLGGRIDSTNVVKPAVSVITSISYDHMDILGHTLGEIAYEKAGIIKPGVPVVVYPQEKEAYDVIKRVCDDNNSPMISVEKDCIVDINSNLFNENYQEFTVRTKKDEYNIKLSLLGTHQLLNCAVAINAMEALSEIGLNIDKNTIINALSNVKWPGRLETMHRNPLVVLDGAHNIDGITQLRRSVERYFKYNKLVLILGILADKQVEEMIKTITPLADKVIAVTPHSYRAEDCEQLADIIKKYNPNCENIQDYKDAYDKARTYCEKDDLILICGSLYMIGDMRKVVKSL